MVLTAKVQYTFAPLRSTLKSDKLLMYGLHNKHSSINLLSSE